MKHEVQAGRGGRREQVPAVSTVANGKFPATLTPSGNSFAYTLSYAGLEGATQQAHIHFGQKSVYGGISVFLCSNLGNGPAGTQACPASPATVTGTIDADDVIGPAGQGIAAGEIGEHVRAMRAGATYANVHSSKFPGGEVRSQLVTSGPDGWAACASPTAGPSRATVPRPSTIVSGGWHREPLSEWHRLLLRGRWIPGGPVRERGIARRASQAGGGRG